MEITMELLTNTAQVYLNGSDVRETYTLYKSSSAQNHATADDQTLKTALIRALSQVISADKVEQDPGVFRVKINSGNGYLVYRVDATACEAVIFHYHWNYNLDLPLNAA
jgi:putative component of toxin-antitoxin plasmid stabilization module